MVPAVASVFQPGNAGLRSAWGPSFRWRFTAQGEERELSGTVFELLEQVTAAQDRVEQGSLLGVEIGDSTSGSVYDTLARFEQ